MNLLSCSVSIVAIGCCAGLAHAQIALTWEMFDSAGRGRVVADNGEFDLNPVETIIEYDTAFWGIPDLGFRSFGWVQGFYGALYATFDIIHPQDDGGETGTLAASVDYPGVLPSGGLFMMVVGADLDNTPTAFVDGNTFGFTGRNTAGMQVGTSHSYSGPSGNQFTEWDFSEGSGDSTGLRLNGTWGLGLGDELNFPVRLSEIPGPASVLVLIGAGLPVALGRRRAT